MCRIGIGAGAIFRAKQLDVGLRRFFAAKEIFKAVSAAGNAAGIFLLQTRAEGLYPGGSGRSSAVRHSRKGLFG